MDDADEVLVEDVIVNKEKLSLATADNAVELVELGSSSDEDEKPKLSNSQADFDFTGQQPVKVFRPIIPPWCVRQNLLLQKRLHEMRQTRKRRNSNDYEITEVSSEGRLLVNVGKPAADPDVHVTDHLTNILQPHQLQGVKFMYDNIIGSIESYTKSEGAGCILAHSMGLGKTLQVITFVDIFFRYTGFKRVIIVCPVNTIQNWANEFEKWLPEKDATGNIIRQFRVFLLNDSVKGGLNGRATFVANWFSSGGVLLISYDMFKLLTSSFDKKSKKNGKAFDSVSSAFIPNGTGEISKDESSIATAELRKNLKEALVHPGADMIVCDEGHQIKNMKTDKSASLNAVFTKRRVVLTGYPLQNNLWEYYCMVSFVRPGHLGTKKNFREMFERPIKTALGNDASSTAIRLCKMRIHVLQTKLAGFVQRRTQHLLKKILPDSKEYVILVRKSPIQQLLYRAFVSETNAEIHEQNTSFNPLKAHTICVKILNHPDMLYYACEDRKKRELLRTSKLDSSLRKDLENSNPVQPFNYNTGNNSVNLSNTAQEVNYNNSMTTSNNESTSNMNSAAQCLPTNFTSQFSTYNLSENNITKSEKAWTENTSTQFQNCAQQNVANPQNLPSTNNFFDIQTRQQQLSISNNNNFGNFNNYWSNNNFFQFGTYSNNDNLNPMAQNLAMNSAVFQPSFQQAPNFDYPSTNMPTNFYNSNSNSQSVFSTNAYGSNAQSMCTNYPIQSVEPFNFAYSAQQQNCYNQENYMPNQQNFQQQSLQNFPANQEQNEMKPTFTEQYQQQHPQQQNSFQYQQHVFPNENQSFNHHQQASDSNQQNIGHFANLKSEVTQQGFVGESGQILPPTNIVNSSTSVRCGNRFTNAIKDIDFTADIDTLCLNSFANVSNAEKVSKITSNSSNDSNGTFQKAAAKLTLLEKPTSLDQQGNIIILSKNSVNLANDNDAELEILDRVCEDDQKPSTSSKVADFASSKSTQDSSVLPRNKLRPSKTGRMTLGDALLEDDEKIDNSVKLEWATLPLRDYKPGISESGAKMELAFFIIDETTKRGEKILFFSSSVNTLNVFEAFLNARNLCAPDGTKSKWRKNVNFCRFDGRTSGVERERLINRFNSEPDLFLFLISTKAGSLGINLVSASRVIIFEASWNPCDDAQAICRIYRYGQRRRTFIYRLIMNNSMEKAIFHRQIAKSTLQQRVVDQQDIDANVSSKELETLFQYDETADSKPTITNLDGWELQDDLLMKVARENIHLFADVPFLHESLMLESEEKLSEEEKYEAELLYEREMYGGFLSTDGIGGNRWSSAEFEAPFRHMSSKLQPSSYLSTPSFSDESLQETMRPPRLFPPGFAFNHPAATAFNRAYRRAKMDDELIMNAPLPPQQNIANISEHDLLAQRQVLINSTPFPKKLNFVDSNSKPQSDENNLNFTDSLSQENIKSNQQPDYPKTLAEALNSLISSGNKGAYLSQSGGNSDCDVVLSDQMAVASSSGDSILSGIDSSQKSANTASKNYSKVPQPLGRSYSVASDGRVIIKQDIKLPSIRTDGGIIELKAGELAVLCRTPNGTYLKTAGGELLDATDTIYAASNARNSNTRPSSSSVAMQDASFDQPQKKRRFEPNEVIELE